MRIITALRMVFSGIFGVSSNQAHQKAVEKITPIHLIAAGVLVFIGLIILILLVVSFVIKQ